MKVFIAAVGLVFAVVGSGAALAAAAEINEPAFGTRQEYRACLKLEEKLKTKRKKLDDHVADNYNALAMLQSAAKVLAEAQKNTSLHDSSQVEAFNLRTEEHNRKIAAANELAEQVKAEYVAYHEEAIEYNRKCATLVLRVNDRDAVLREYADSVKDSGSDQLAEPLITNR